MAGWLTSRVLIATPEWAGRWSRTAVHVTVRAEERMHFMTSAWDVMKAKARGRSKRIAPVATDFSRYGNYGLRSSILWLISLFYYKGRSMINRSFFGIAPPKLTYDTISDEPPKPVSVVPKEKVTLFINEPMEKAAKPLIQTGTRVSAGQKLKLLARARERMPSPRFPEALIRSPPLPASWKNR
jgi:hypothetical protein